MTDEQLLTLEDILEEIVGEYEDEFSPERKVIHQRHGEGSVLIDPSLRFDEFEKLIRYQFPAGNYGTLAGLVYGRMEKVPLPGDAIELPGCRLTVVEMDGPQITKVRFERI